MIINQCPVSSFWVLFGSMEEKSRYYCLANQSTISSTTPNLKLVPLKEFNDLFFNIFSPFQGSVLNIVFMAPRFGKTLIFPGLIDR